MAKAKPADASYDATTTPKSWRPTVRFVDFKGRKITVKIVDEENGFKPGQVAMTVHGPAAISHAESIKIDKDGYFARTEREEKALLKLANLPVGSTKGASHLVTWENREMPAEQRKAELTAAQYKARIDELQDQVADKADLEAENQSQKQLIEQLQKQLASNKGG